MNILFTEEDLIRQQAENLEKVKGMMEVLSSEHLKGRSLLLMKYLPFKFKILEDEMIKNENCMKFQNIVACERAVIFSLSGPRLWRGLEF